METCFSPHTCPFYRLGSHIPTLPP